MYTCILQPTIHALISDLSLHCACLRCSMDTYLHCIPFFAPALTLLIILFFSPSCSHIHFMRYFRHLLICSLITAPCVEPEVSAEGRTIRMCNPYCGLSAPHTRSPLRSKSPPATQHADRMTPLCCPPHINTSLCFPFPIMPPEYQLRQCP